MQSWPTKFSAARSYLFTIKSHAQNVSRSALGPGLTSIQGDHTIAFHRMYFTTCYYVARPTCLLSGENSPVYVHVLFWGLHHVWLNLHLHGHMCKITSCACVASSLLTRPCMYAHVLCACSGPVHSSMYLSAFRTCGVKIRTLRNIGIALSES